MVGPVWHYFCVALDERDASLSDDDLVGSAGIGREFEGGIDVLLMLFGTAGFSDMDGAAVATLQGRGDTHVV